MSRALHGEGWDMTSTSKEMMTILDAWGWCTGTTQRDGMNTCIPVADSF